MVSDTHGIDKYVPSRYIRARAGEARRSGIMNKYMLCLAAAVIVNAASNVLYKSASLAGDRRASAGFMIAGLLLGIVNVVLYTASLRGIKLNIAYPIFSAASIVLVFLASFILYKEAISAKNIVGVLAITLGIGLVVA
jgi:multidrug transporter EmrE-like cation transporter